MKSNIDKLEWSTKSVCDENRVFEYNGIYYRGIYKRNSGVLELIQSDFFNELVEKKYVPRTTVSQLQFDEFEVVLEHETAEVITYPHEWTFQMFKDVAVLYLEIYKIIKKHGYALKDGHPYNFVFFGSTPKFVDIGSFYKSDYMSLAQFNNCMVLPLLIWSKNYYRTAFNLIKDDYKRVPFNEIISTYLGLITFGKGKKRGISRYLHYSRNEKEFIFSNNYEDKEHLISKINRPDYATIWGTYHNQYDHLAQMDITPRFKRIIEIINGLDDVKTLYDVACNQGFFSLLVSKNCRNIERIASTDFDENAVNEFYLKLKESNPSDKISVGVTDIISSTSNFQEKRPAARFKSDCVVILALTHHLLLGQNYNIDVVFDIFSQYTDKYLLVEFMPIGLWAGEHDTNTPAIPDYYTEDWFQEHLSKHFVVLNKEKLEKNRVMFVCKKND